MIPAVGRSCSELHRERGGPLLGTAPEMEALVLVECRRPWDGKVHKSADFPAGLKEAVKRAESCSGCDVKLLATPSNRSADELREVRVYRRARSGSVSLVRLAWDGSQASADALVQALLTSDGEPAPPLLLVCTHGSRDRCCGSLGYPLAEAVRAEAGDWLEVLETSHIGGHRYAPTALSVNQWRCYGDMRVEEAPAFVRHLRAGTVLPGRHRGACWLDEKEQVAEGAPWESLPEALESVRVLSLEKLEGARKATVEVRRPDGTTSRFRVVFSEHEFHAVSSCKDLPEGKTKEHSEFRIQEFAPQD